MSSRDGARHLGIALCTLAVALGGCGKKGPPLPPLRFVPAPTQDLAVAQRGDQILLRFTYPKTTAAGATLEGVTAIEVVELDRPAPPPAPATPASTTPPAAGTTPAAPAPAAPAPGTTPPKPPAPGTPGTPGAPATPAVGAPSVPPPPANLPGNFPAVDPRELAASAKPKLKLQGADVTGAVLGDKVVIALPVGELHAAATAAPSATAAGKPATTAATAATTGELVRYFAVRTTGPKGDRSAFSNQAALLPKPPPPPPGDLRLTPKPEGIEVAWGAPAGTDAAGIVAASGVKVLGFNIYRRDATAKAFAAPLRAAFFGTRSIVDPTARFGESYIYGVTSIADPNPLRESAFRGEAEVKYVDRFPPPAPTDVVALAESGKVRIVWRASAAPDLAGYLVYRRVGARGGFQKLTPKPIAEVQYLDPSVAAGATYTYRVTAVDQSGNESAPGEAATRAQ